MTPTEVQIPSDLFKFAGQSVIDLWNLHERITIEGPPSYERWSTTDIVLGLYQIKKLADDFSFWQHRNRIGRPAMEERDLLIAFLCGQFFDATWRRLHGILVLFQDLFEFTRIPKKSVLSKYNCSKRWLHLWKRFFSYILSQFPERHSTVISDATGYSGRKSHWRDVDHGLRCIQDWVKAHVVIESGTMLILSYSLTDSGVHESQEFANIWESIHDSVRPKRSLADGGYTSNDILQLVRESKAIPFHGIRKDAVLHTKPETAYQKLVNFALHWVNRFKKIYGERNLIETAFWMMDASFGYRIRSRSDIGRKNEVQAKFCAHNIRMLAMLCYMYSG